MSERYSLGPGSEPTLIPFSEALLDHATTAARVSERRRMIVRLHDHDEPVQRMLNAVEPESYARPHRHNDPTKHEVIVALRGTLLVASFTDDGSPLEGYIVGAGGPVAGIEIPPGVWHTIAALEEGTVLFEINSGPYDPATHKEYAHWSPPEEDVSGGTAFLAGLRAHFGRLIPALAARDVLEAEEGDIC